MIKRANILIAAIMMTLMTACGASDSTTDETTNAVVTNKTPQGSEEEKSAPPKNEAEYAKLLAGTWTFKKAASKEDGSDRSSKYVFGMQNDQPMRMTLHADGRLEYEQTVVDALKITEATWEINKHKTKELYYFNTIIMTSEGVTQKVKEKIIEASDKKFVFGKFFIVEYTR